ncbi:protein kinase 2B, chloroplastic-like [Gossypium australe]|uniref:Protein kinase 2B, chloroplastic-like n=1 Tax=Gossypium australe TaxID=47621 RepID=A0A5B6UTS7_9ROSI|nr:protein kinase 2B, chloroplastic-like [Gossypium australe]
MRVSRHRIFKKTTRKTPLKPTLKFFSFMTRNNLLELLVFNSEIKKTAHRNRKEVRKARQSQQIFIDDQEKKDITVEMDNNLGNQQLPIRPTPRTMYDYAKPTLIGAKLSIVRPTIVAKNFDIKPNII